MSDAVAGEVCKALLGGRWVTAQVLRVGEDGTFTLRPDPPPSSIMAKWYGVTRLEIARDDRARWDGLMGRFGGADGRMGWEDLHRLFGTAGIVVDAEPMRGFWAEQSKALFGLDGDARLDADQAYALILVAGTVARRLDEGVPPGDRWYRMYWNQVRMGGRDPDDLARPVTVDDALAALGLAGAPDDSEGVAAIAAFEAAQGVRVPAALVAIARRQGAADAVNGCHCNSPEWVPPSEWALSPGDRPPFDAAHVLTFLQPHQGEHRWAVAFDDGPSDARVFLTWDGDDGEQGVLTAPSLALFLWDLAQTGACWYEEVGHESRSGLSRGALGWVRDLTGGG